MSVNQTFVAPAINTEYVCKSGNTYMSSSLGIISLPLPATPTDVQDLLNVGCVSLGFSTVNVYLRKTGTFTANGATAVTIADTAIAATDFVDISLNTVGGTPAGAPFLSALTAGTSWQVKSVAGDTSVYNYQVFSVGPV